MMTLGPSRASSTRVASGSGGRGAEARGAGAEGDVARQHARTPLGQPAARRSGRSRSSGHALVVELQLAPGDDQPADLHLARPGPPQREARQVVAPLRNACTRTRGRSISTPRRAPRGRSKQRRPATASPPAAAPPGTGSAPRRRARDAQVRDLDLQGDQAVAHSAHGDRALEDRARAAAERADAVQRGHLQQRGAERTASSEERGGSGASWRGGSRGRRLTPAGRGGRPSPPPGLRARAPP